MNKIKYFVAVIWLSFSIMPNTNAVVLTVGGTSAKNTAGEQKWIAFEQNVIKGSNNELSPRMLIYGELGPEENLVNGIRRNRIHVANWSGLATTTVVPEMALLYAPFLFDNYDEADFIMDNYLFDIYAQLLAEKDIHLIQWDEIGFNQIYGHMPYPNPKLMKGKRFRTSSSLSAQLFAEAIGADAIPLGYTDIITGLQTSLVEAGENAIIMYVPTGIASEAEHLTLTNHSYATSIIVMRKSWLDSLKPQHKKVLISAYVGLDESRAATRAEWRSFLDSNSKWNFNTHTITNKERDLWKEVSQPVSQRLIDKIGGASSLIWDRVQEGKKAFAASQL